MIIMATRKPQATVSSRKRTKKAPPTGVRTEPFVIELFVEDGTVKSTSILHVPTSQSARWNKWNGARLARFIRERGGLLASAIREKRPVTSASAASALTAPVPAVEAAGAAAVAEAPADLPAIKIRQVALRSRRLSGGGTLAVEMDLETEGRGGRSPYRASVMARSCENGARIPLATLTGLLAGTSGKVCVEVPANSSAQLKPGLYFVSASVELSSGGRGDLVQAGMLEMA
jgi:hypothetical protein